MPSEIQSSFTLPIGCLPCCSRCPPDSSTISMVTSGISACDGGQCINAGNTNIWINFSTLTVQPSVTLANGPSGFWNLERTNMGDVVGLEYNPAADCSGVGVSLQDQIIYRVQCSVGTWEVFIETGDANAPIFYASGTGVLPKGMPITNQSTACNDTSPVEFQSNYAGFGGTVTLTW